MFLMPSLLAFLSAAITLSWVAPTHVMCSMVSRPQKLRAVLAIVIELVSRSPVGSPAGCQVMSMNRGLPCAIPVRGNVYKCIFRLISVNKKKIDN